MKIKLMILLVILVFIAGCAGEPKVSAETPPFLEEIGKQQTFYGPVTKYRDITNGCIIYLLESGTYTRMTAVKP